MCIHLLKIQIYFLGGPGTEMGVWGSQLFGTIRGDLAVPPAVSPAEGSCHPAWSPRSLVCPKVHLKWHSMVMLRPQGASQNIHTLMFLVTDTLSVLIPLILRSPYY